MSPSTERRSIRRLRLQPDGRWHVVAFRVPRGSVTLTVRVTLTDAAATSVVCGVPSLTWRKSLRGVSKSLGFAVRTLGVAGTVRHLRRKIDTDHRQYAPGAPATRSTRRGSRRRAPPRRR